MASFKIFYNLKENSGGKATNAVKIQQRDIYAII